jgi:hypothetical protein
MTAKQKNIKKGTTPETKKDLVRIDKLVQECLHNLAERHYYKSPNEDKTIDNLREVVKIIESHLSKRLPN